MTTADDLANAACSFCGKGPDSVERLIAGPNVWICDGCVRLCHGILESLDEADPDETDEVLSEIAQAQQLALQGERAAAEQAFFELWEQIGPDGDPLHRTSVAHYMADVQESAQDELEWDLRALAAADVAAADELAADDVRGLYASLHVNLAADYDRLGRADDARRHLGLAERAEADLPPDGYGDLVRSEIAAVRERLG